MKKLKIQRSMFETSEPEVEVSEAKSLSSSSERSEAAVDPEVCPKCGRKSLKSVRPMEYGGLTHYCGACPGDEPGEPLRFTPGLAMTKEAFVEKYIGVFEGPPGIFEQQEARTVRSEIPAEQSIRIPGANDGEVQIFSEACEEKNIADCEVCDEITACSKEQSVLEAETKKWKEEQNQIAWGEYVRMVQIFFDQKGFEQFSKLTEKLAKQYNTGNVTDTVMEALKDANSKNRSNL